MLGVGFSLQQEVPRPEEAHQINARLRSLRWCHGESAPVSGMEASLFASRRLNVVLRSGGSQESSPCLLTMLHSSSEAARG